MGIVSRSQVGGSGVGALLFSSVLGADAASIDTGAASIAATQNVLEVFFIARTDEAVALSTVVITLNNDGGANYDRQRLQILNVTSTASVTLAGTSWGFSTAGASAAAGVFGWGTLVLPGYAGTTAQKTGWCAVGANDTAAGTTVTSTHSLNYRSAAAISRLKIAPGGGTVLKAGSALFILGR